MLTKLTALACVVVAVAVTTSAAAGPVASKQRIAIQVKDGALFVLTPLTPGALKPDSGVATFCCWTERHVVRDGQAIDINDPQMTLTGKRGTIVARNRIEYVDLPNGWAVFTGTWKVISGTGDYAGLSGGGRGAGVALADGKRKSQFEGRLGAR